MVKDQGGIVGGPVLSVINEAGPDVIVEAPPPPVRIHVPQVGGSVTHYAGHESTSYKVSDAGEIVVPFAIAHQILAGIPESFVVAETPRKPVKPEAPAKE